MSHIGMNVIRAGRTGLTLYRKLDGNNQPRIEAILQNYEVKLNDDGSVDLDHDGRAIMVPCDYGWKVGMGRVTDLSQLFAEAAEMEKELLTGKSILQVVAEAKERRNRSCQINVRSVSTQTTANGQQSGSGHGYNPAASTNGHGSQQAAFSDQFP